MAERRRTRLASLAGLAALAILLPGAAAAASASPAPPSVALDPGLGTAGHQLAAVVVSGRRQGSAAVARAVRAAGGTVGRDLPIIDGVSALVPADALGQLARNPAVVAVTADRSARLSSASYDQTRSASAYAWTTGAPQVWATGDRGAGVTVAVLDTGVSDVNDLAGRIVHGPDLSGEGRAAIDTFGHGTVMAGIIAGDGAASQPAPRTGIAPAARIVSVKVAGANGAADVSTVLAAMQWVSIFAHDAGIGVLNLSWGVPSTQDPSVDPLDFAVEKLWRQGVVVVVAAGNGGPGPGTVLKPADDPLVLTVGAFDDRGDTNTSNDIVPAWSAQGPTSQGLQKPDVVASGRTLVATRSPGSTVETQNPTSLIAPAYIKGSGTSEATAVVSGTAALLLSRHPSWTPDQVKAALVRTASPLVHGDRSAQGAGRIAAAAALTADVAGVTAQRSTATGSGPLDGSRGASPRLTTTCGGVPTTITGELTAWCAPWSSSNWTSSNWTSSNWTSSNWTSSNWTSSNWTGTTWSSSNWTSSNWTSSNWTSSNWTGNTFQSAFWGDHPQPGQQLPGEDSAPSRPTLVGSGPRAR